MQLNKFHIIMVSIILFLLSFCGNKTTEEPIDPPFNKPIEIDTTLKIGAYYFNGWYPPAETNWHITKIENLSLWKDREPIWGWVTGTPELVRTQIDLAADAGIKFFSFCWYFDSNNLSNKVPLNGALVHYMNAPNKERLKFCLLVANHDSNELTPDSWKAVKNYWINYFRDPQYLTVDGQPLIIFFNVNQFPQKFGGTSQVKETFNRFRTEVKSLNLGFDGVKIAACVWPTKNNIQIALDCGFDILTSYNDHVIGLNKGASSPVPIDSMRIAETEIWNMVKSTGSTIIPTSTLNWDVRPWSDSPETAKRFYGFSEKSIHNSLKNLKDWIYANPASVTKEKIGLCYAWNEYGEGCWMTPSIEMGDSLLRGIKRALK